MSTESDHRFQGIGVIGCGYWGVNYLRVLSSLGRPPVVCADADARRLADVKVQFPQLQFEESAEAVLAHEDVGAVIVSTTASTHHELASLALRAGKDVLVEKPLTLDPREAADLVTLARDQGRVLMVAHTFMYNPAVRRMRELLQRGEAGSIYYLSARRTHLGLIRSDVSALWDLAPHDVSIFSFLLDARPQSVTACGGRYLGREQMDTVFATLTYPSGILGNIFVSWVDTNKVREVAVVGSRARYLFDDLNNLEKLRIFQKGISIDRPYSDFGDFQLLLRDGDIISPRLDLVEPLKLLTEHFLSRIMDRKQPLSPALNGWEVVTILDAIDRSARAGGTPVSLDWTQQP
jgi:predicted dehydrogenase